MSPPPAFKCVHKELVKHLAEILNPPSTIGARGVYYFRVNLHGWAARKTWGPSRGYSEVSPSSHPVFNSCGQMRGTASHAFTRSAWFQKCWMLPTPPRSNGSGCLTGHVPPSAVTHACLGKTRASLKGARSSSDAHKCALQFAPCFSRARRLK